MVQKIHPRVVIWVPNSRLMWADHQKKLTAVPSIYKEVHALVHTVKSKGKISQNFVAFSESMNFRVLIAIMSLLYAIQIV